MSEQGGLVPEEGVDEGSADSTQEGPAAARTGQDLLGEPPHGAPADDEQTTGPVELESAESRAARDERAPGQQLQEGEG